MRILVPVDSDTDSLPAAEKAAELATSDARIRLVAVIKSRDIRTYQRYAKIWQLADGSAFDKSTRLMDRDDAARVKKQEAALLLDAVAAKLNTPESCLEKTILIGDPVKEIVAAAKRDHADMIVLSSVSAVKAQNLIDFSPCPVLIIRAGHKG